MNCESNDHRCSCITLLLHDGAFSNRSQYAMISTEKKSDKTIKAEPFVVTHLHQKYQCCKHFFANLSPQNRCYHDSERTVFQSFNTILSSAVEIIVDHNEKEPVCVMSRDKFVRNVSIFKPENKATCLWSDHVSELYADETITFYNNYAYKRWLQTERFPDSFKNGIFHYSLFAPFYLTIKVNVLFLSFKSTNTEIRSFILNNYFKIALTLLARHQPIFVLV